MRILLVGEYSRVHNSLKEGLLKIGHEVKIVGTGDDFKNFPVDFSIDSVWFNNYLFFKFCKRYLSAAGQLMERRYRNRDTIYLCKKQCKRFRETTGCR